MMSAGAKFTLGHALLWLPVGWFATGNLLPNSFALCWTLMFMGPLGWLIAAALLASFIYILIAGLAFGVTDTSSVWIARNIILAFLGGVLVMIVAHIRFDGRLSCL